MAFSPTPNYGFTRPEPKDKMSDFEIYLNENWDKVSNAAVPPMGTVLPTSGDYKLGDRFYKTDTKSIYILVCKDANWGWHWRPVQDAISPWVTVPTTCLNEPAWTLNPVAANPFQIALDNKGKCYWRGVVGPSVGTIARNASPGIFKPLPQGINPRERGVFMVGHSTVSVGTDGTNLNCYQGARIYIYDDQTSNQTVRCFGGIGEFNRIHLAQVNYAVGTAYYTAV